MITAIARTGSKLYLSALLVAQISALLRYVLLAQLLGPEQVGLIAIIVLTAQFFDSITDAGSDRFLIQNPEGGDPAALSLVQLFALVKGAPIAVTLVVTADLIAHFSGAPQLTNALRILAVVPLLTGLTSFDFRRAQRDHNFGFEGKVVICSEVAGFIATAAAAYLVRDYTAILYGLAGRALTLVVVSHLISSLPYRVAWSERLARRLWQFGIPLMLNGLLLFIASQSDRVIISRWLGLDELGRYSVLLLTILYPAAMIAKFLSSIYLPLIAGSQGAAQEQATIVHRFGSTALLLASAMVVGFALVAPVAVPIVFGAAFAPEKMSVILVGALLSFRMLKVVPVTVALGLGKTGIVLVDNAVRVSAVPLAIAGVVWTGEVAGVVAGLVVAELISISFILLLVNRFAGWPLSRGFDRVLLFVGIVAALIVHGVAGDAELTALRWIAMFTAAALVAVILRREWPTVRESASLIQRSVRFRLTKSEGESRS